MAIVSEKVLKIFRMVKRRDAMSALKEYDGKKNPVDYVLFGAKLQLVLLSSNFYCSHKKWRKNNPKSRYKMKYNQEQRYRDETILTANNHYAKWHSDEVYYLKAVSQVCTAREIAFDLGRTYKAIINKASKEKIPLLVEAKLHGLIKTGR